MKKFRSMLSAALVGLAMAFASSSALACFEPSVVVAVQATKSEKPEAPASAGVTVDTVAAVDNSRTACNVSKASRTWASLGTAHGPRHVSRFVTVNGERYVKG